MTLPLTNDNLKLTPQTAFAGPVLTFDFAGLEATNEVEPAQLDDMLIGILASDLAWDAVLSSFAE